MKTDRKNYNKEIFIGLSIILTSLAQIILKYGMMNLNSLLITVELSNININQLLPTSIWVFIGLICYASSMIAWMLALREYELSVAYPLLSISYILVYILAILIPGINQQFSLVNATGLIFITYGVISITRDASNKQTERIC